MSFLQSIRKLGRVLTGRSDKSGPLMLAAPVPEDPYSPEKLAEDFRQLISKAYDERATAIRLQNDHPDGWVRFVVNRQWKSHVSWSSEYAERFMEEAFNLSKNQGVKYHSRTAHDVVIDEDKVHLYGSMTNLFLQYAALAGERTQLTIHIVYEKPEEMVA